MTTFDHTRLFGGRFKMIYPGTEEGQIITLWIEHPSDPLKTFLLAESGMMDAPKDAEGNPILNNSAGMKSYEQYRVLLAEHCIAGAENLTGWPDDPCVLGLSGWARLSGQALSCFPKRVQRAILVDVGDKILTAAGVTEEEGNASMPPLSGDISKTSTKTTADGSQAATSAENPT